MREGRELLIDPGMETVPLFVFTYGDSMFNMASSFGRVMLQEAGKKKLPFGGTPDVGIKNCVCVKRESY
jgi:hypothetical protein